MRIQKLILPLLLTLTVTVSAQERLTLDTCRARALRANLALKQAELKVDETGALEKAAFCQMLPHVSANGGYMWMEKSVNLLSEEQKTRLNHLGDNVSAEIGHALHNELDNIPIVGNTIADALSNALAGSDLTASVNGIGQNLVQGLETDTRNMGGGMVTLSQPIYLGGKLLAAHRSAALLHSLAGVGQPHGVRLAASEQASTSLAVVQRLFVNFGTQYFSSPIRYAYNMNLRYDNRFLLFYLLYKFFRWLFCGKK